MTPRRIFLNPFFVLLLLPAYVSWRLLSALPLGPAAVSIGVALIVAACAVVPLSMRTRGMTDRRFADALAWVGLTTMGFFSSLFVLTLLRDLVLVAVRAAGGVAQAQAWAEPSASAVITLTVFMTVVGFVIARRPPRIVNVEIAVTDLPESLRGFSIAQISDVHVGPTIKRQFVEGIVNRVNALGADVIAVTGDLVDGTVGQLSEHTAPLARLSARHGAFFVTGNHEYYSGERAWTAEIRRLGLHVLKNEHVVLEQGGSSLILAGVTDITAHHFDPAQQSDPAAALHGAPRDAGVKVLLAHQPGSAAAAAEAGYDVQLSGHTHGGQFWPWNFFIRYVQPFTGGLNRLRQLWVYVSRGTGYWGPPNRFGVSSEITFIRLVPAGPNTPA